MSDPRTVIDAYLAAMAPVASDVATEPTLEARVSDARRESQARFEAALYG